MWFSYKPRLGPNGDEVVITGSRAKTIRDAQHNNTSATFHAVCHSCAFYKDNATGENLRWCMGCAIFNWDSSLPNRRVNIS